MRETNIWVLITDSETARICSTREGISTSLSAVASCGTFAGREDKIFRAWRGRHRRNSMDHSATSDFAAYLAQVLLEAGREHAYDSLIVIAAPDIMKDLTRALAPETYARLIGSIIRDVPQFDASAFDGALELQH